jgi:glycosyltransferase involved in cell wall biosynthesis
VQVLHVEAGRHLYGGARQVLELMTALAARGIGGLLACPDGSAIAVAARARGLPVATHPLGGDLDVAALGFLGGLLRQRRFALLHAHSRRGADFFGGLAAGIAGVPAVLTRRVDNPDTPVVGALKYRAYRQVVSVSSAVRAQLVAEGVPPERIRVIHSAVSVADCAPLWSADRFRGEFGLAPGQPVIAVVAQLIPRKGHELLLAAWPAIRARFPGARLLVFGTGPLEGDLVARAGASAGVHFAGFRPDLREFLGHIDVLVHPALAEGLGLTLLEAQAAGVPVVGFRSGGVIEAVADGGTGILAPAGDSVALGDAVSALLADPDRRRSLGAAGRARIAAEFSPVAMAAAYAEVYADVLGR